MMVCWIIFVTIYFIVFVRDISIIQTDLLMISKKDLDEIL